ncbi:MAG: hypothetical protein RBR52_14200 [Thiomonas sp.]|uniref:hypothetical protein n=1 Tax=Thiomonas sp. TaxID=2047785 RepID=UPI002A366015|nr:hypothetical protein [Thiomonas sp.]MDY0331628.1 hypothetical protein [Thiomonas sp.]
MNDSIEAVYASLRAARLSLRYYGNGLHIEPRYRVTPELRRLIAQNREALIAYLQTRNPHQRPSASAELQAWQTALDVIERIRAEVRALPF